MKQLFLLFVFFVPLCFTLSGVAAAQDCSIPPNVTIISYDPCYTWRIAQWAWEEARKQMWIAARILEPVEGRPVFTDPKMEAMPPFVLIEKPGGNFYVPELNLIVFGLFNVQPVQPEITYAYAFPTALVHEFGHFIWWVKDSRSTDWWNVNHGGEHDDVRDKDPYWRAAQWTTRILCPRCILSNRRIF